jgi:hypothetical protein
VFLGHDPGAGLSKCLDSNLGSLFPKERLTCGKTCGKMHTDCVENGLGDSIGLINEWLLILSGSSLNPFIASLLGDFAGLR